MNWRKFENDWKDFTSEFSLNAKQISNRFINGQQDLYIAEEDYKGFKVCYRIKVNRSAFSSSYNAGNEIMICSPISSKSNLSLTVVRSPLWKRLVGTSGELKIDGQSSQTIDQATSTEIGELIKSIPDAQLSIKKFERHSIDQIPFGQKVALITSKHLPRGVNELKRLRETLTFVLLHMRDQKILWPAHNNEQTQLGLQ